MLESYSSGGVLPILHSPSIGPDPGMSVRIAGTKSLSVRDRDRHIATLLRAWTQEAGFSDIVALFDVAVKQYANDPVSAAQRSQMMR